MIECKSALPHEIVAAAERGWRLLPLKKMGKEPLISNWPSAATKDLSQLASWHQQYPGCNWGVATGSTSQLVAIDIDGPLGRESAEALERSGQAFPATLSVSTGRAGGGEHRLYQLPEGVEIRNSEGKLGRGIDVRGSGGYVVTPPSVHPSGKSYQFSNFGESVAVLPTWLVQTLVSGRQVQPCPQEPVSAKIQHPNRTPHLCSLIGKMRSQGYTLQAAIGAALAENAAYLSPPKEEQEVRDLAIDIYNRYSSQTASHAGKRPFVDTWPKPMSVEAFHGLAGEFVRLVEPNSESDPHALLLTFLLVFGCMVGRGPYYQVESTRHGVNGFGVLVGESAKARKGTTVGRVTEILGQVDPEFLETRTISGLSTGEGLIAAVRDPGENASELDTGRSSKGPADPGVVDKRLLVVEQEFGGVLQQMSRPGNMLSPVLRSAWDGSRLRVTARSNNDSCQKPHISVLGNITIEELRRLLTATDMSNGFGNRYLWCCTRRSKKLPHGGRDLDAAERANLISKLKHALIAGRSIGRLEWDPEARPEWETVYSALTESEDGIYGSMTARSEAQVVRLACLYALLDASPLIRICHLQAASAVWAYCDASVLHIFGGSTSDKTADRIMQMLSDAPDGLTQTEISNKFSRHRTADELALALNSLEAKNLITSKPEQTAGGAATRWNLAE